MFDPNETDRLKRQVEMLERKRKQLFSRSGEKNTEEDTLVYSLADLMTLLLIFFILLYANASGNTKSVFSTMASLIPGFGVAETSASFSMDPPPQYNPEAFAMEAQEPETPMEPVISIMDEKSVSGSPQPMEPPVFSVQNGRIKVRAPEDAPFVAGTSPPDIADKIVQGDDALKIPKQKNKNELFPVQTAASVRPPGAGSAAGAISGNPSGESMLPDSTELEEKQIENVHSDNLSKTRRYVVVSSEITAPRVKPPIPSTVFPGWIDEQRLLNLQEEISTFLNPDQGESFPFNGTPIDCELSWEKKSLSPPGKAHLIEGFHPFLRKVASFVSSQKNLEILVSGHTDDTPIHTEKYPSNWELSVIRAVNVGHFLAENGVDPARMTVEGYSEFRPVRNNTSDDNKQANRRVEISLMKPQGETMAALLP